MFAWLFGTVLALILATKLLDYFGLFGVLDFLTATLRLIAAFLFGMACLIVWMTKRRFGKTNSGADSIMTRR